MVELLKTYIENKIQLVKFELISISAKLASQLINFLLVLILALIIMLMLSMALAFEIGHHFDSTAIGFAIIGGIYLLIFIIYLLFAQKKLGKKVKDYVVKISIHAQEELTNK